MDKLYDLCDNFQKIAKNWKKYMRNYMKNRYHTKREELKKRLGGKCVECGSVKDLHFDHKDKKKKTINLSDVHFVKDELIEKELKNIQLLCNNCHKEKTRKAWDYTHPEAQCGSYWRYRKYKCRCSKCTKAYKEKLKSWR